MTKWTIVQDLRMAKWAIVQDLRMTKWEIVQDRMTKWAIVQDRMTKWAVVQDRMTKWASRIEWPSEQLSRILWKSEILATRLSKSWTNHLCWGLTIYFYKKVGLVSSWLIFFLKFCFSSTLNSFGEYCNTINKITDIDRQKVIYRFSFSCPWVTIFLHSRELN